MIGHSRATVSRKLVIEAGPGGGGQIVIRPHPPGSGLVFHRSDCGATLPATLDLARVEGGVLVIAGGGIVLRGTAPILAACAAAGISDADIELGGETEADGALFDALRAALAAAVVDLFAEVRTPLRPAAPVQVRDGRGLVTLVADDDDGPDDTRPRGGDVVLVPADGIASLPFGPAWQLSVDLLALIALLGVPLAAVVRARHASLELLHAAICRAAARPARTGPVAGVRRYTALVPEEPAMVWPKRQSPQSRVARLL